jgi:putative redox protein
MSIEIVWEGGLRYRGGSPGGPTLVVDGAREVAPGPVDSLLVALGACSAIDVVEILEKRRTPPERLSVEAVFERAEHPPRRLVSVHLVYRVATASDRAHVERAVKLSLEKYCSVAASLAEDLKLTWAVEVEVAPEGGR